MACSNEQTTFEKTNYGQNSDIKDGMTQETSCPVCEDNNSCTENLCSADTGYKCEFKDIAPCCGNGICEINETDCADCPVCDSDKCHNASYDYEKEKCVTTEITPCCGNSICEEGEDCPEDCPTCTTERECFKSVYDFNLQRCVEKPLVPCCGNGICDRGENCETCNDCKCKTDIDLSDFPDFLDKGTLIVVGENGKSRDVLTASNLGTKLYVDGIETRADVYTEFSSSELANKDLIVIGSPCDNSLWEEYQGVSCGEDYFDENTALIKLVIDNGREIVYVGGYTSLDNEKAANYLSDHSLSGMEIELDTSGGTAVEK